MNKDILKISAKLAYSLLLLISILDGITFYKLPGIYSVIQVTIMTVIMFIIMDAILKKLSPDEIDKPLPFVDMVKTRLQVGLIGVVFVVIGIFSAVIVGNFYISEGFIMRSILKFMVLLELDLEMLFRLLIPYMNLSIPTYATYPLVAVGILLIYVSLTVDSIENIKKEYLTNKLLFIVIFPINSMFTFPHSDFINVMDIYQKLFFLLLLTITTIIYMYEVKFLSFLRYYSEKKEVKQNEHSTKVSPVLKKA